jgi:hypothetical protein
MSRVLSGVVFALSCAVAGAAVGQDTTVKSEAKVKGDQAQTVTYTGCVQTGTETKSYVLDKVVPVSRTTETTTDASGAPSVSTTTTYALVPGDTVEITRFVGHKVEVTGMLIPGGDMKSETKTKIEREDAKDTEVKEKVKSEGSMPQFRVISIRNLAERCE